MKKFFLILTITFLMLDYTSAQVELVDVKDPVYDFLKRMQLMNIIPSYNSSTLPVSRSAIAEYLLQIKHNIQKLTATDLKILKDHEINFEYDMYGTVNKQRTIFSKTGIRDLLNNNTQKHLYFHTDSNRTFFTDLSASISLRNFTGDQYIKSYRYTYRDDHTESPGKNRRLHGELGANIRGTLYNSVAFYLKFSKGHFENDDERVINERSSELLLNGNNSYIKGNKNHNSFEGYLRYQTNSGWLALTFGRTQLSYGFGYIDKLFLSDNSAPFDFGKLDVSYKAISYSFTYGSLKGDSTGIYPEFSIRRLSSKNIATHLLNLTLSDAIKLGLWESVIISDQPFSFTYLNPISFLTSADLSTGAAQTTENNSLLGIDIEILPVKNLSLQTTLLIDDLTFGTLGTKDSLNENKFGWQLGALWNSTLNISIAAEFTHLDPFVYSHRSNKSTYTNRSQPLGHSLPPNSDEIAGKLNFDITNRLHLRVKYQRQRSGKGIIVDTSGNLLANYGGNINFGLGDAYLRTNGFLDGTRINREIFTMEILWEPVKQFYLEGKFQYRIIKNLTEDLKYNDSYYFAAMRVDL